MTYQQAIREAMSASEVAAKLSLTPGRIRQLTRECDLPTARKIGRDVIYWPGDVEALRRRIAADGRTRAHRPRL